MTPQPTVLLFDIDGTLITTGGACRGALEAAIAEVLGVPRFDAEFSFGGMTDRAIFRRALSEVGVDPRDEAIGAALDLYLGRLAGAIAGATRYAVHPGVRPLLDTVSRRHDTAVGLGTGNVEAGARAKLEPVGLNPYFAFGGFGSDAEDRATLIGIGARRGAEALALPLSACRVVVIGDTVRDVTAAHANGFCCVAVATGAETRAALDGTDALLVVDDLSDPRVLPQLLS